MSATGYPSLPRREGAAKPKIGQLRSWLTSTTSSTPNGRYRHRLIKENRVARKLLIDHIIEYYRLAHADAMAWIRNLVGDPLDPLGEGVSSDHLLGYPCNLDLIAMQGCFGEVFAGLVAEHFDVLGEADWEVPAFLFQFHNAAFEELEARDREDPTPRRTFGRTGDDCLAFRRAADGKIISVLYCEAKCSQRHDSSLVSDAHEKVCNSSQVNIPQIIDVLQRRGDPQSLAWVDPLRRARFELKSGAQGCERCDFVSYICGQHPVQRETWITPDRPHENYKSPRRFEAAEIHLFDVEDLVRAVYDRGAWT